MRKGVIEGNMKMIALNDIHYVFAYQIIFYEVNAEDLDYVMLSNVHLDCSLFWVVGFKYIHECLDGDITIIQKMKILI